MDEDEMNEIVVDFGNICRLCLKEQNAVLVCLFTAKQGAVSLATKITNSTGIKISEDDGFPPWACEPCVSQLDIVSSFIAMCHQAQETLQNSYIQALADAGFSEVNSLKEEDSVIEDETPKFVMTILEDDKQVDKIKEEINEETGWICYICSKSEESAEDFVDHMRDSHNIEVATDGAKVDTDEEPPAVKVQPMKGGYNDCKYCGGKVTDMNHHLTTVHKVNKGQLESSSNLQCMICLRVFVKCAAFQHHVVSVHGEGVEILAKARNCCIAWQCDKCNVVFSKEVTLTKHYVNEHSMGPPDMNSLQVLKQKDLFCDCGNLSETQLDAGLHAAMTHDNNTKCPACDTTFDTTVILRQHIITVHKILRLSTVNQCLLCWSEWENISALKLHLADHHMVDFQCRQTNQNKDKQVLLDIQPAEDTSRNSEFCLCNVCGRAYVSAAHWKRHILEAHISHQSVQCPDCPKQFSSKVNLHNHYKRRHLQMSKRFVCSFCGHTLKGKAALQSHEDRLHRNLRQFKCTECPEAFSTAEILKKHLERHMLVRPMHQCVRCSKQFTTVSGYERHVKTHDGVKEFTCDVACCRKSFYTKFELRRHIKFHNRDFKHTCTQCGHSFMSPSELKKHSTKHTGDRPFKCHLCPSSYSRRDDEVKHLKRVHNLRVKRVYGTPLRKLTGIEDAEDNIETQRAIHTTSSDISAYTFETMN